MRNFLHSCIYLYLSLSIYWSILRSCNRKFVFRFWAHRQRVRVVDVIVTWKREHESKAKSMFVGDLEISPKKSSHRENSQTNYLYINKSFQKIKICCSFFEALSINENFQLNYSRFKSSQSKNNHNNRGFIFPFSRKNYSPFSLNFVYGPQSLHRDQW